MNSDLAFKSGQRVYPRIDFPAHIIINEHEYKVTDWSLGGFALSTEALRNEEWRDEPLLFSFDLPQGRLQLTVRCKPVRIENGYAVGFEFIGLNDSVKETLSTVINSYFSGEKIALDTAIDKGVKGKLFEYEKVRLAANWTKFASVVSAISIILVTAFVLVYQSLFVVKSDHAAVAQNVIDIQATKHGELSTLFVELGQSVVKGQPLFSLASQQQKELIREKKALLASIDLEAKTLANRLEDASTLLSGYENRLEHQHQSLTKIISTLKKEIDVQDRQYLLLNAQFNDGVVDELTKNENLLKLYGKKRYLIDLERQLATVVSHQTLAKKGLYSKDEVSSFSTVNELSDQLEYKRSQIDILSKEVNELENDLLVKSPCHCVVAQINAHSGPVTVNRQILSLTPSGAHSARWITALVPLSQAGKVYKGANVEFTLASETRSRTGKIESVSYYSTSEPNIYTDTGERIAGLPKTLPRMQQYTLVQITPDETIAESKFSEPAQVNIGLGFWHTLFKGLWF